MNLQLFIPILVVDQYTDLPINIIHPITVSKASVGRRLLELMSPSIAELAFDLENNVDNKNLYPYIAILSMIDCFGPSYFSYPKKWYTQYDVEYTIGLDHHTEGYFSQYLGPPEAPSDLITLGNLFLNVINNKIH